MRAPRHVRVMLKFDLSSEPIGGRLEDGSGASGVFVGWLELMSVIESARDKAIESADAA